MRRWAALDGAGERWEALCIAPQLILHKKMTPPALRAGAKFRSFSAQRRRKALRLRSFTHCLRIPAFLRVGPPCTKIDSTKVDISVRAAGYALFASTVAVSSLGFVFEKKVAVVDAKPVLS